MKMKEIILIGAGGHALSVKDCIDEANEFKITGFIDEFKTENIWIMKY